MTLFVMSNLAYILKIYSNYKFNVRDELSILETMQRQLGNIYVVRNGGDTKTTISPLTNSIPTLRVAFLTISSSVSSSISVVVTVSSTSPRIKFKCWSYACE